MEGEVLVSGRDSALSPSSSLPYFQISGLRSVFLCYHALFDHKEMSSVKSKIQFGIRFSPRTSKWKLLPQTVNKYSLEVSWANSRMAEAIQCCHTYGKRLRSPELVTIGPRAVWVTECLENDQIKLLSRAGPDMRRRITMKLKWEDRDEGKEVQINMREKNRGRKTSESELVYF